MQKYQNSPRFQRSRAASLGDVLAPTRYCYHSGIENSVFISASSQWCLLLLEAKLSSIKIYFKPSSILTWTRKSLLKDFFLHLNEKEIHSWNTSGRLEVLFWALVQRSSLGKQTEAWAFVALEEEKIQGRILLQVLESTLAHCWVFPRRYCEQNIFKSQFDKYWKFWY